MSDLEPCALCGNRFMDTGNADGLFPAGRTPADGWIARCGNPACGMEVIGDTKKDARERWNRRPQLMTLTALDAHSRQRAADLLHTMARALEDGATVKRGGLVFTGELSLFSNLELSPPPAWRTRRTDERKRS